MHALDTSHWIRSHSCSYLSVRQLANNEGKSNFYHENLAPVNENEAINGGNNIWLAFSDIKSFFIMKTACQSIKKKQKWLGISHNKLIFTIKNQDASNEKEGKNDSNNICQLFSIQRQTGFEWWYILDTGLHIP